MFWCISDFSDFYIFTYHISYFVPQIYNVSSSSLLFDVKFLFLFPSSTLPVNSFWFLCLTFFMYCLFSLSLFSYAPSLFVPSFLSPHLSTGWMDHIYAPCTSRTVPKGGGTSRWGSCPLIGWWVGLKFTKAEGGSVCLSLWLLDTTGSTAHRCSLSR